MPVNKSEIAIPKPKATGAIWVDTSTVDHAPTDAETPLPTTAVSLGYVGAEGITNNVEVTENDIEDMSGDVVMTVTESTKENFSAELLQLSTAALKEIYGPENVTETADLITIKSITREMPIRRWYVELVLTGGRVMRKVIHAGKVKQSRTVQYKKGTPISHPLDIACFPGPDGSRVDTYITKVTA